MKEVMEKVTEHKRRNFNWTRWGVWWQRYIVIRNLHWDHTGSGVAGSGPSQNTGKLLLNYAEFERVVTITERWT